MNILVNASNLRVGGGVQVADSFISQLGRFTQHKFYVVLPDVLWYLHERFKDVSNVECYNYNKKKSVFHVLTNRDRFLDTLVDKSHIDIVFTVFGPSVWTPRVKHICGFAMAHCIYPDSVYWDLLSSKERIKLKIRTAFITNNFGRTASVMVTENPDVTQRLQKLFPRKKIYTVTNYYNQVYDIPHMCDKSITLPRYDGITLLTIAAPYPHKNMAVIPRVIRYLKEKYPSFKFRFAVTVDDTILPVEERDKENILYLGKVNVDQCPYLYEQSDYMFLPTLLECFSASYPEAMRMDCPILTSDLPFARGLCGDAAEYFNPMSIEDIAEKIYALSKDQEKQKTLIENGRNKLKEYDNYNERGEKYIKLIEQI